MNILVEKNLLIEMELGANIAYVLEDSKIFLPTYYKVLQSQKDGSLIPCMKVMYNGKIQLYYLTQGYKTFASIMNGLDTETFFRIAENILAAVIDVNSNGFLSCENIDISFDNVYVDLNTFRVRLIYIPVSQKIFDDESSFESELRGNLRKIIDNSVNMQSPKAQKLASYLSNGTVSLEELYKFIKTNKTGLSTGEAPVAKKKVKLVALDAPEKFELAVTKDEFLLGKKEGLVDGVIRYNAGISRKHCCLIRKGNSLYVQDLGSTNGTYINKKRLMPNEMQPLKNGDILALANSKFKVTAE